MNLREGLDWRAQQAARAIAEQTPTPNTAENLATKSLGILQESGVFACVLFLHTRRKAEDPEMATRIMGQLQTLAEALSGNKAGRRDVNGYLEFYSTHVCSSLDRMLLIAAAWEQTLIYTRYWAKARTREIKAAKEPRQ